MPTVAKRKICVVTGSRAEYGLLYWVMRKIENAEDLDLQLVVTGMHLTPEYGSTYRQIEDDGFCISNKVEMYLSSDSPSGIAKSMGLGIAGFGETYETLQPDIVLMLGDRFELLAAASAALVAALPIAHIHGGEITEGAFDEAIRHAITKMSHLHFTSTETYRQRVIQLGEHPDRVFNFGAPGLDNIVLLELLDQKELEEAVGIKLGRRSLLVTWHPVTLEPGRTRADFQVLLDALHETEGLRILFTKANADTEGRIINQMIDKYVATHPDNTIAHTSLGQLRYLSAMRYVDGVVGNSSSGIIEAPSLATGTINIGDRQLGRVRTSSIIDCVPTVTSIKNALSKLFDSKFQSNLQDVVNPHGGGNVAEHIVAVLRTHSLENIVKKSFYDLESQSKKNDLLP
jgi:GDP/UDP-N,N'-diacetylbacillosamine 2-epimerase (hydrolysing)